MDLKGTYIINLGEMSKQKRRGFVRKRSECSYNLLESNACRSSGTISRGFLKVGTM